MKSVLTFLLGFVAGALLFGGTWFILLAPSTSERVTAVTAKQPKSIAGSELPFLVVLTSVSPSPQTDEFMEKSISRIVRGFKFYRLTWIFHLTTPTPPSVAWQKMLTDNGFQLRFLESLTSLKQQTFGSGQAVFLPGKYSHINQHLKQTRTREFYPEIVFDRFKDAWFYLLDWDNAFHCDFFNITSQILASRSTAQVVLFKLLLGKTDYLNITPVRCFIDTAQILVHSDLLQKHNIFWGGGHRCPDGIFIENCAKAAEPSSLIRVEQLLTFHNRLFWPHPLRDCKPGESV